MRYVIISGAPITEYSTVLAYLKPDDFNIFCDSGLKHSVKLGIEPNLIIGDFDSHQKPDTSVETIVLPCEKDDTDTVYAVKEAVKRGAEEILMVGAIGARLDHSLGNISSLLMLDSMGIKASIVDDYSQMEIVSSKPVFIRDDCKYFSLIAIGGSAAGINIKNAKYPLENGGISSEYQYGISNEVISSKTAEVSVKQGRLLLIKIYRE